MTYQENQYTIVSSTEHYNVHDGGVVAGWVGGGPMLSSMLAGRKLAFSNSISKCSSSS